jgi:F-type H+-transporting ATPase subunit gamma
MEDLARLEARIDSLEELRGLFSAMQAMAAARVRAAHTALGGIRKYADVIEQAISDAVSLQRVDGRLPPGIDKPPTSALVVICSEHGFAGAFNRLLLARAKSEFRPGDAVAIVGRRGASIAAEHALSPAWTMPMATHIDGILATARRVAVRLRDIESVRVAFGRYGGGSRFEADVRQILPPDPSRLAPRRHQAAPLHQLEPRVLLQRLLGELLLAELILAMTESFASENSARLQIMQAADHNIADKLQSLTRRTRQLQQDAMTSELLEVVAGGEAVVKADHTRSS